MSLFNKLILLTSYCVRVFPPPPFFLSRRRRTCDRISCSPDVLVFYLTWSDAKRINHHLSWKTVALVVAIFSSYLRQRQLDVSTQSRNFQRSSFIANYPVTRPRLVSPLILILDHASLFPFFPECSYYYTRKLHL